MAISVSFGKTFPFANFSTKEHDGVFGGGGEVIRIVSGCGRCMTGEELIGRKVDSTTRQQGGPKHGDGNRTRLKLLLQFGAEKMDLMQMARSGKTTMKSPHGIRF